MASTQRRGFKIFMRVAAVMLIGAGLSACSSVPGWVDPTTWMGPDTPAEADNGQYPDLSTIPDRPDTASSEASSGAVADSLAAARSHVQYSAETLRGGTETAAPPPEPQSAAAAAPPAEPDEPAAADDSQSSQAAAPQPAKVAMAEAPPPAAAPQPAAEPAPMTPAAPAAGPVPGAQPAMPAGGTVAFQPSKAPPLDASVAQFVPAPILQRYAQTGPVGGAQAPVPASNGTIKLKAPRGTRQAILGTGQNDVGGPESMSGAVVADLGAVGSPATQASVYAGAAGMGPVAVVLFSGNSAALSAAGRKQVAAAAAAYRARGGQGYIRVVGHSSSRTGGDVAGPPYGDELQELAGPRPGRSPCADRCRRSGGQGAGGGGGGFPARLSRIHAQRRGWQPAGGDLPPRLNAAGSPGEIR